MAVHREDVIRGLLRKGGRACAADLANDLPCPVPASAVVRVVEQLADEGVVRRINEDQGRQYQAPYQTVYELR